MILVLSLLFFMFTGWYW